LPQQISEINKLIEIGGQGHSTAVGTMPHMQIFSSVGVLPKTILLSTVDNFEILTLLNFQQKLMEIRSKF